MGTQAIEDQETSISVEEPQQSSPPTRGRKRMITGFGFALLLVLAFAIFAVLNFQTVVVSGQSMEPTFHTGKRLLVSKAYWLVGPIKDNDIVVLHDTVPNAYIIKRVVYSGGEKVDWKWVPRDYNVERGPLVVPVGSVYLLGDNRPVSEDSRVFGPRELSEIIGKVIVW